MPTAQPLIGSVLERKPGPFSAPSTPISSGSTKTGFPTAQHRSKSAFSRSREEKIRKNGLERLQGVPIVQPVAQPAVPSNNQGSSTADRESWRRQVEEENERRVEAMTEEEREEERREILQRFGQNVGDILQKAKEARVKQAPALRSVDTGVVNPSVAGETQRRIAEAKPSRPSTPLSALCGSSTRPSSRAERKLRFADVTPNDVHVYESAPPSPRKKALALPPPSADDGPVIHLGEWKSRQSPTVHRREAPFAVPVADLEEGTPEDIRRRFFPEEPANDPSLEWIENTAAPAEASSSTLRFDLTGTPIPPSLSSTLPTYLGLHHHADSQHAGYSLDDVFLLSRSTVPGQRASMLGLLARIARKLANGLRGNVAERIDELVGQESELRQRILAAGVEAMGERGSLGARAIEVMWECIVGWDDEIASVEGVEVNESGKFDSTISAPGQPSSPHDPLSSLPLDFVLSQISSAIGTAELPPESLSQLLAIVHRLAQHSNDIASSIVTTSGLVANIVQTFLLTPIPPTDSSPLPDPVALQVLTTLVLASRENASALLGPADALLRFVTALPLASPFSQALATSLLTGTLRFYTALASYGMYSHIATTASDHLAQIGAYVLSEECHSKHLREAWLGLLEAWMVCARDPHRTTPSHEILWSQVVGWGWGTEVLELRQRLTENDETLWAALWRAEAAWLEGAKVNAIKGGEAERAFVVEAVRQGFSEGVEQKIAESAGWMLDTALRALAAIGAQGIDVTTLRAASEHASTLAAVVRFWLSCLPSQTQGPLSAPPFIVPFARLSALSAIITTHPLWSSVSSEKCPSYARTFLRPFSLLLSSYLQLSPRIPGTSEDLWLAQAFAIITRLLPGDEEFGQRVVGDMTELITLNFMESRGWNVPAVLWEKGGMKPISHFLAFTFFPQEDLYVAPLWISSQSISLATTQRLPAASKSGRDRLLPLSRDWSFCPLDHLLRSGQSEAFKSLPSSWNYSETEVVRATLLFAKISREILRLHGLTKFLPSREEMIFAGMKVFMLEHEQQQNDTAEEVFRDRIVEQLLDDLFAPFAAGTSPTSLLLPPPPQETQDSLEAVASRFLGPSTPFYQYYTDFVALYDAISFSHPLFARLLLPPLSMRFPSDFRKYLWADYGHVVKTIRTPVEAVLTGCVGEYLWPVEEDAHVLGAYLRALVQAPLEGFVRLVAIHHIACNIWPDLRSAPEEQASKLLRAVVDQDGLDVVREVVLYRQQVSVGTLLLPPACFAQAGEWKALRLEFVERCGGEQLRERLKNLLE
ncbi:hypothetical protein SCP_0706610 [Sparassis crispa]|uniref:RNA polymerase II-associated protein n=1 Tax=Sparassis crispa TaxID=139825 RepID=A0A401GUR5_9APHY|nr:hypothetical protein SCP_0706610 [Sparassis crispa]GBE85474.1 hypothetical protein SCP_0706610 [Sparassis crispa]